MFKNLKYVEIIRQLHARITKKLIIRAVNGKCLKEYLRRRISLERFHNTKKYHQRWRLYTAYMIDTVYTVGTVDTVYTVFTVYSIQTTSHCLNRGMYAYNIGRIYIVSEG